MPEVRHARLIAESRKCLGWTSHAPFLRLRGHWLARAGFRSATTSRSRSSRAGS